MAHAIYKRVLITGGGGMLARAIVRALRSRGADPIALDHNGLDITNDQSVRNAFEESGLPTLVLNCAAFTKVDACEEQPEVARATNAIGAANVAKWALALCTQRLVHFSTDFVFDGTQRKPYRPDDAVRPLSVYGASKLEGEQQIASLGPTESLIIRTSWLYGPGGPNFVQAMLNAARAGKKLSVVDDQIGSPTFTDDLAATTLDLIDANATGIYHATNSGQTSWFGFAKAIFEEFNLQPELLPTTSKAWKDSHPNSAIRPAYSVLDCGETERVIGRKLPDWRDARIDIIWWSNRPD